MHHYNRILATKKNEIMQFAATQMDLEIFISSEGSQTEREKYCMAFSGYRIQNETIWEYDIETPTKSLNLSR